MKFSKTHTDLHGNSIETVSIELNQDAYIEDVLEAFTRFLRAVGYHFDGNVEIVAEESIDLYDKSFDWGNEEEETTPAFEGPIEGFNDGVNVDELSTDLPPGWPFPVKSKP
jgi:hypothetical protein